VLRRVKGQNLLVPSGSAQSSKEPGFPGVVFLSSNHEGRFIPRKVNIMSSKLLVSMLALGLATGTGAALAQSNGGTEKQGTGIQSQTGGTQVQSQTSTGPGDESATAGRKGSQIRQGGKQMGQAGQENAPGGANTRHTGGKQMGQADQENTPSGMQSRRPGEMKRGSAERSGQNQGTMQSQTSPTNGTTQNESTRSTGGARTTGQATGQATTTGETSTAKAQGTSTGASLTGEERGRITEVIKRENIRPESNVNFSISVGTAVPRTVHLHRLPPELVRIEPRWRPYEFILVGDELVIVNPRNFEIVAVMPA